jgi:prepilin signal peptidase PulO-like enzyme (type II secretory pathway)
MILLLLLLFGLAIGSFLNVLVYRLNTEQSPLKGRSFCPKCRHQLAWKDNLPLLSFGLLRGKCRYCHSPISWQYPIVEATTGLITVFLYIWFAGINNFQFGVFNLSGSLTFDFVFTLFISYSLIAIFVSDVLYLTIPDEVVIFDLILSLVFLFLQRYQISIINLITALAAAAFFYFLVLITRGKGMGLGDVKLALVMGLILGWPKIIFAMELAFLTGALTGVILILIGRKKMKSKIAFGPFLCAALWVVIVWGNSFVVYFWPF